jgi:hypothetical protein
MQHLLPLAAAAAVVSVATAASAQVLTFQEGVDGYAGTLDKEIRSSGGDDANGDFGEISIDGDDGSPGRQPNHALIRFENVFGNGPNQIALGTGIDSATITLTIVNPGSGFTAHQMLVDWDESSTWAGTPVFGGDGITPGSDAVAMPLSSFGADNASENVPTGKLVIDVTEAYQNFSAGATDYGVGFVTFENGTNGIDFITSESFFLDPIEDRPLLTVSVPEPATASLLGLGSLAMLRRRRA